MNFLNSYNEFIKHYWSKWYIVADLVVYSFGLFLNNDCLKFVGIITFIQDMYIFLYKNP